MCERTDVVGDEHFAVAREGAARTDRARVLGHIGSAVHRSAADVAAERRAQRRTQVVRHGLLKRAGRLRVPDGCVDRRLEATVAVVTVGWRFGLVALRAFGFVAGTSAARERLTETEAARPEHAHAVGWHDFGGGLGAGWRGRFGGGPVPSVTEPVVAVVVGGRRRVHEVDGRAAGRHRGQATGPDAQRKLRFGAREVDHVGELDDRRGREACGQVHEPDRFAHRFAHAADARRQRMRAGDRLRELDRMRDAGIGGLRRERTALPPRRIRVGRSRQRVDGA